MKKINTILSLIAAMALISSGAFAVNKGQGSTQANAKSATASQVPQAQIDRVKKREEMKQRRDEMLKVRQQLIDADNPGNLDGQKSNN